MLEIWNVSTEHAGISPLYTFTNIAPICSGSFLLYILIHIIVSLELHVQVYHFFMISRGVLKESLSSS